MSEELEKDLRLEHLEAFRFHVFSQSRPKIGHLVDLESLNGHGECACEDFQFNRLPRFNAGHRGEETTCKHLRAAQRQFTRWAVLKTREECRGYDGP